MLEPAGVAISKRVATFEVGVDNWAHLVNLMAEPSLAGGDTERCVDPDERLVRPELADEQSQHSLVDVITEQRFGRWKVRDRLERQHPFSDCRPRFFGLRFGFFVEKRFAVAVVVRGYNRGGTAERPAARSCETIEDSTSWIWWVVAISVNHSSKSARWSSRRLTPGRFWSVHRIRIRSTSA